MVHIPRIVHRVLDTPDQFIPLLKDWYRQNGLTIPDDIAMSEGANGIYVVPADIETKQGMGDYLLDTAKYSEEAKGLH